MPSEYKIMVVAGEASGDLHAAKLVRALRATSPEDRFAFFGAGSSALRTVGMETVVNADNMSVVGLPEIAKAIPMFLRAFRDLKRAAVERRPDAVILVDFPDFNLKLAKSLKKRGLRIVYYISPQLWAWRKYRLRTIKKFVDLVITILPFEKSWYAEHGVHHVEYVGSPLAREVHAASSKEVFCFRHGLDPGRPIVSLLPGSRHKEITNILPTMIEAAARMAAKDDRIHFVIALASARRKSEVDYAFERAGKSRTDLLQRTVVVTGETYDALNASDAAAVASGTATLETGIIGTPMAIVYKTSKLNYKLLRPLISVEHFGLINLIAEQRVATEMIQDDFTAQGLADELFRLLDPAVNDEVRSQLREATDKLGHGGASARAAELILKLIWG